MIKRGLLLVLMMITISVLIFLIVTDFKNKPLMAATSENVPPNIILILADDLGFEDVGFNGCKDIPTPNIDKIAYEGVVFKNAYVTYPVCGPSRAGLITGRHQDRFGFGRNPLFAPNDPEMGLPIEEETLATVLKKIGYQSVALGKWHLGAHESQHPLNKGFDDFYGFLSGGHQYFPELWTLDNRFEAKKQFDGYKTKLLRNFSPVEEKEYLTDALSREAVSYIEKSKDKPFFMYLAYNAPHTPLQATDEYLVRFAHLKDDKRKTYAAMVSAMDDGVGTVLEKLEALNLSENTIIFFLSDNGGPEKTNGSNNGLLRGQKGDLFEGGIHVPFAMRWPAKIPKKTTFEKPISSLDIFATAIAQNDEKVKTKNKIDGVDLLPYILGEQTKSPHDFMYWRKFDKGEFSVRNDQGNKLMVRRDKRMLFNLEEDIGEQNNSIEKVDSVDTVLQNEYDTWNLEMIPPIFMGLKQDEDYNKMHPNRFVQPN